MNETQVEHWNGPEARHWIDEQERYERQLAPFAEALLRAAAIGSTERVLDVGCGCGGTTMLAASWPVLWTVPEMVTAPFGQAEAGPCAVTSRLAGARQVTVAVAESLTVCAPPLPTQAELNVPVTLTVFDTWPKHCCDAVAS